MKTILLISTLVILSIVMVEFDKRCFIRRKVVIFNENDVKVIAPKKIYVCGKQSEQFNH